MSITINGFRCVRCLSDGTQRNSGTYLKAYIDFQSTNFCGYYIDYKLDSGGTWSRIHMDSAYYFDGSVMSSSGILGYETSFMAKLIVSDDYGDTKVATSFIPSGFALMDINASGKGIAFGKVSEKPNELEFGMSMYDKNGTQILNGLAFYESGGSTNADATIEELFLAYIPGLSGGGSMYFVRQMFYGSKSAASSRVQVAYPYNFIGNVYRRYYSNGWSGWILIGADDSGVKITSSGTSGIWNYKRYSDGTAECFGKIPISGEQVGSTLGNWYRSAQLYGNTAYSYPVSFTEAPALEMMYQTTNSNGGLLWMFSQSTSDARYYLPTGYIIRPTTATGINGIISIIAKGKV